MHILGGYLENYTELKQNFSQENESNEIQNEVEIWTFQHAIGKFSKHKEIQVKQLCFILKIFIKTNSNKKTVIFLE